MSKLEWKRVGPMSEETQAPGGWRFSLYVSDGVVHARVYDAADDFVARVTYGAAGMAGVEAHRWALEQIASWAADVDTKDNQKTKELEAEVERLKICWDKSRQWHHEAVNDHSKALAEVEALKKSLAECCASLAAVDSALTATRFGIEGFRYDEREKLVARICDRLEQATERIADLGPVILTAGAYIDAMRDLEPNRGTKLDRLYEALDRLRKKDKEKIKA